MNVPGDLLLFALCRIFFPWSNSLTGSKMNFENHYVEVLELLISVRRRDYRRESSRVKTLRQAATTSN